MTVALYRRYRPDTFEGLVGQDVVAQTLRTEVRTGRIAHAYLFAGMRGTGKTSAARILARAVNCEHPREGDPDNTCAACTEILGGAAVDVLEIDAASNRGIDEMRDLRDKVKYLPASLRRKVYIIDEAHMLTTEAWNAFLKTLEEPPEHVLFVLATTEPHKVPETVRSRVQRFDFRRISSGDIAAHMRGIAAREHIDIDDEALALIARSAQGSARDALSLLDQCASTEMRPITLEAARRALGLTDSETLHQLVRSVAGADAAATLRTASLAFEAGADPRQLLRDVARLARAAELTQLEFPEGADVGDDEAPFVADVAAIAPAGFWLSALELIAESEMNLRQPVDARLLVELCLLRMLRPPAEPGGAAVMAALEARLAALERVVADGTRPPSPGPGTAAPAAPEHADAAPRAADAPDATAVIAAAAGAAGSARDPGSVEGWRGDWQLLIDAVARSDAMLAGVLRDCRPAEASPGTLVIGAKGQFHYDRIRDPAKADTLTAAATAVAGHAVAVEARFTGETRPRAHAATGALSDATQAVLETFAGSRVTASRLRDGAEGNGPPATRPG